MIRNLEESDIEKLAHAFTPPCDTVEATRKRWQQYFQEHTAGIRTACVLDDQHALLGYGSLLRASEYPFFRNNNIPEINSVWIGEKYQRQGLGTKLLAHLESLARKEGYTQIGLGVGLTKDYGPAQKLYFRMGYVPDGNGATYKYAPGIHGEKYPLDDDLLIWLIKPLK